jgi:hypothetical protein
MLSPYSSQALAVLLALLPNLSDLVSERGEIFQIEMITPAGWEFWLSSEEEEQLTVGFAEYHCHFGNFAGGTAKGDATEAATFIQSLQRGELALAVWYRDEEYVGSAVIEAEEKPQQFLLGQDLNVQVKAWG